MNISERIPQIPRAYAEAQRAQASAMQDDPAAWARHIRRTLCRCLPPAVVTEELVSQCCTYVLKRTTDRDPLHTAAIHAFAATVLMNAAETASPLMHRLHHSALRLLPVRRDADRDDLRLGLQDGRPRSCEEIALRMRKPLTTIHEMESALLTYLTSFPPGGPHEP